MKPETLEQVCERVVRQNVHYCVSSLVSTVASGAGETISTHDGELPKLCEQAQELCTSISDYEEAARDHLRNGMDASELAEYCEENDITACAVTGDASPEALKQFADAMRTAIAEHLEAGDDNAWQSFCDDARIDPYEREIFEHWIISDWLADKLEAFGERVERDFAGLTVWGRTTSGQAIAADYVIQQIAQAILQRDNELRANK